MVVVRVLPPAYRSGGHCFTLRPKRISNTSIFVGTAKSVGPYRTHASIRARVHRYHLVLFYPPCLDDLLNVVNRNAGGRTSELTSEMVKMCQGSLGIETCMHLTCTNMPKEKVDIALSVSHIERSPDIAHGA